MPPSAHPCSRAATFPTVVVAAATYFAFATVGVAAVATINSIVPETKGKTLEEIEAMFN